MDTKISILQCVINREYKLMNAKTDIRKNFDEA